MHNITVLSSGKWLFQMLALTLFGVHEFGYW